MSKEVSRSKKMLAVKLFRMVGRAAQDKLTRCTIRKMFRQKAGVKRCCPEEGLLLTPAFCKV